MDHDYLTELLNAYWFAPPVALWRSIELRTVASQQFERPLLDLGCGDGLIGQVLFCGSRLVDVGFDPWPEQLVKARDSGTYAHLDHAQGESLPYPSGSFATVFSNSVLEHIANPAPVVREAARVLTPGGRFIFTVPSDHFRRLLDGYVRRLEEGDPEGAEAYARETDAALSHYHYHSPAEWREKLAEVGLALETARYYVAPDAVRLWDRMNGRYGTAGRWSPWSIVVSPRVRWSSYRDSLRRLVVRRLSRRWRGFCELDVAEGEVGGGLMIVARKHRSRS